MSSFYKKIGKKASSEATLATKENNCDYFSEKKKLVILSFFDYMRPFSSGSYLTILAPAFARQQSG
jgi:hypothetical protein